MICTCSLSAGRAPGLLLVNSDLLSCGIWRGRSCQATGQLKGADSDRSACIPYKVGKITQLTREHFSEMRENLRDVSLSQEIYRRRYM